MSIERLSPCKVNLLLNVLGRRDDGFHELETVLLPVPLCDVLTFAREPTAPSGIRLECTHPALPVDQGNLVYRAARFFLEAAGIREGLRIRLEKRLPLAAGLGAGSANAAVTLLALNELFGVPLPRRSLEELAAGLGSDIPFFLQDHPALGTGRGERIEPLTPFPLLASRGLLLIHPGFGVPTPWAYQALARFPEARDGRAGRARKLIAALQGSDVGLLGDCLYNSLERPVLEKYPVLRVLQEFLRGHGAVATLMSGSGSTTFAVTEDLPSAVRLAEGARQQFGGQGWMATVEIGSRLVRAEPASR